MKACECCSKDFAPKVTYQIYCSSECRELATKEKISYRQQIMRAKSRSGKKRKCSGGCETIISIYNNNGFCGNCMINKRKVDQMLKELKGLFDYEQEK
jgi:hypothetical protein